MDSPYLILWDLHNNIKTKTKQEQYERRKFWASLLMKIDVKILYETLEK